MDDRTVQSALEESLEGFEALRREAQAVCEKTFGDEVYVRGLIEFSNYCRCSCKYCGLRVENSELKRYRLEKEDILEIMEEGYQEGYRSFVLQSGEDTYYTAEDLGELVRAAKKERDLAITLSIGERPRETYRYLKACGADRFLLKHECADSVIYDELHPHSSFEERLRCLVDLKELGYQTGSGFMIGLPKQSTKTLAKDLKLIEKLQVHMAGIGPFIPNEMTPMGTCEKGSCEMTLKAVAIARLLLPEAMLPVTTSLGVIDGGMREQCLNYGANVVMQKLQPTALRKLYALYPKEIIDGKSMREEKRELEAWLKSVGKKAVFDRGDHPTYQK
ncbi:MAG: [FeFe] hydrogenase H-cluster radical SAM maturase HydE [Cellulosilyticaceae bacterium]